MQHVLDDLLIAGLKVVIVGTAVGAASAARGAYYAGPGNKFWRTLAETGMTPRLLRPEEFRLLTAWGVGLTDIAKCVSGSDASLQPDDFDVSDFVARIKAASPRIVAFNGVKAARVFYSERKAPIAYGPGVAVPDIPRIYVLPSTSGAASAQWSIAPWRALADEVKAIPTSSWLERAELSSD